MPVPNAFLPTDTRLELTYAGQSGPARFETAIQHNATALAPFRYAIGGKEYYVSTAESVSLAGLFALLILDDGSTLTADARFDSPVILFDGSSRPHQFNAISGHGTVTIAPDYGEYFLDYTGTVGYLGTERVTTPAGTFESKRVFLRLYLRATVDEETFSMPFEVDFWYARGLGVVQRFEAGQILNLASFRGPDGDSDGVIDTLDAFPADPRETEDLDGDGVGDNGDTDDDGDTVVDAIDRFPRDAAESTDFDADGIGDNGDPDDDNDGLADVIDPFPRDVHNTDTDDDGTQDFYDTDDDNDTFADAVDRFPLNAGEWFDFDNDGTGDNGDFDDDNDSVPDDLDAYPFDFTRTVLLSVDRTSAHLNGTLGIARGPGFAFDVTGNGIDWEIESEAPWLSLDTAQGTFGSALVIAETDLTGLDVGPHSAEIMIRDLGDARTLTIDVTLTVSLPALSTTADYLTFDGTYGWTDLTRPVDVTLNTSLITYPVTVDVSFPVTDAIRATLDAGVASSEPRRLNVTIDPAKMRSGRHTGTLTLHANVLGRTISRTIAIEATGSQRVVYPAADGVAFTRMYNATFQAARSFLTRSIKVLDSYGVAGTTWTATSDQPWLSVTPAGVSDGALTLTADHTGLADGLHWATVSISSSDGNVNATMPIRVSFWVASSWPNLYDELPGVYRELVSDPVRPYVYAHNGTGAIDVYHFHTRTALPPIDGLGGTLGPMVTSTDGRWLFVLDPPNGSVTRIDLDDTAVRTTWPLGTLPFVPPTSFVYARPNGHPVLLLSDGRVVDAETGGVFPTGHLFTLPNFGVARAYGSHVCGLQNSTPPSVICFDLLYGDQGVPDVKHSALREVVNGFSLPGPAGPAADLAFTADGEYVIVGLEQYPFPLFKVAVSGMHTSTLPWDNPSGTIYTTRAVATAADGSVHASIVNGSDGVERLLIMRPDGSRKENNQLIEGSATTLRARLVTSSDTAGTVFLIGDMPPLPTTSSTVQFVLSSN